MGAHATTRRLTPPRIIALAVIALLIAGLVAIKATGGSSHVTVPSGAHAGQIFLHPCTFGTEDGKYAADCGTLVVPENRQHAGSRLIALPITRVRATHAHAGPPIFYLQGGPGLTNMVFPMASRYAANHDVVLVGYRGVDGSVRLDCREVSAALTGVSDLLTAKTLGAYNAGFRNCATRLSRSGIDLLGYNSVERVDDMEAARSALGYRTVNLISESAGTRTAMVYAWRHPKSINRSVMLGVNPPGHYLYDGATIDAQIKHYSDLCAKDAGCRRQTTDLAASMQDLAQHLPKRWFFLPIKPGNVKLATFYGLVSATSDAAPLSSPQTIETWTAAARGDASGMWLQSTLADLTIPTSHVWGDVAATGQIDDQAAAAHYANGSSGKNERDGSIIGNPFTDSLWGRGGLVTAWPHSPEVDQYTRLRPSSVSTLLISGDLDFATPAQFATKELLPTLRNGHQVILRGLGHTPDTWNYEKSASNKLINTFFDTGRVDPSGYPTRAMNFRASPTHTMIAKIVLGSLAALSVITIFALLWLPARLRRRGSVGSKTSVVTRTVYAPFLGLGGWSIGVLLVLIAWPSVSIAYQPLTVVSVAAPVAFAVYFAWVNRAWSRPLRQAGLCAAIAGGAVGAWLGLHAFSGLFATFGAVAGAVLGANLAVIVVEVCFESEGVDDQHPSSAAGSRTNRGLPTLADAR